jgi:AcrR family transcriptional regulator
MATTPRGRRAPTTSRGAAPRPKRRTQAERSAATRALLLDATIESLVDVGYAKTTTTGIAERAGVSRGAQMHHFPSKSELVAHAVEHLAEKRAEQARREAERLPRDRDRVKAALDLLWENHKGPLFDAALELSVAARTDPELKATLVPVERKLAMTTYTLCVELFGEEIAAGPRFERVLGMSLTMMQGLALLAGHELGPRQLNRAWATYRDELATLFEPGSRTD